MNLTDYRDITALLQRHGFRFSKSMGQNFLTAAWVPQQIAAESGITAADGALEIGPGVGCLTAELAKTAGRVTAVELDERLRGVLGETLADFDNVSVVFADALKAGNTAFTVDTVLPVATDVTGSKSLVFSYVVLALRFAAESLPTLLAAATAYFAIGLLDTMEDGAFTQESAAYAPKLAEWCVKVLKLSVLFALAVNVLQAVCAPLILSTSISIPLPVLELCFVLAALLGARLIASNVALAADNDLFI